MHTQHEPVVPESKRGVILGRDQSIPQHPYPLLTFAIRGPSGVSLCNRPGGFTKYAQLSRGNFACVMEL